MPGTECEPTGRLRRLRGPGVARESARAGGGPTGSVQLSVSLLMFELAEAWAENDTGVSLEDAVPVSDGYGWMFSRLG